MLALSDDQLQIIMTAAGSLPVEKRLTFLERVACRMQLRGAHFTDRSRRRGVQGTDRIKAIGSLGSPPPIVPQQRAMPPIGRPVPFRQGLADFNYV
jgi:hypothetical protein